MVLDYYKLREQPFNTSPDPRYLFASDSHREALASLLYGIEAGCGFMALIAEPGMGKTTLLFNALSRLKGKTRTAFIFQALTTPEDFLRAVLSDLGIIDTRGGIAELQAGFIGVLLDMSCRGERLVLVIDEAQNLSNSLLEFVRMLSNFETPSQKLMHIILSGQPELARKLMSDELRQLRQRISTIAQIRALSAQETEQYLSHRLTAAGLRSKKAIFTKSALRLIARHSEGIPRKINILCFNALSVGYATRQQPMGPKVIREVIADLDISALADGTAHARADKTQRLILRNWLPRVAAIGFLLISVPAPIQGRVTERLKSFTNSKSDPHLISSLHAPLLTNTPVKRHANYKTEVAPVSRNFQLMQELENKWIGSPPRVVVAEARICHRTPADEEVLGLVQRVFLLSPQNPPKVVVFAGIDQGTKGDQLCWSTADVLAKNTSGKVCLVEADFRARTTSAYGAADGAGFADALVSEKPICSYVKSANSKEAWSWIPAGRVTSESVNLLGSDRMKALLSELRNEFDFVIVMGPQLNFYNDSSILGQLADGLVLILEAGSTRREAAQAATSGLRIANIPILAAVLNNRTYPIPEPIYRRL